MLANTATLKSRFPYFVALMVLGLYANYLFQSLSLNNTLILLGICAWAVLKPETFCISPKNYEYNFLSALPFYLIISLFTFFGFIVGNYMGIISVNLLTMIIVTLITLS